MNPAQSPLETLRQLREMFDAGTLTQAEFEALKQQLVFGPVAAAPPAPTTDLPAATVDFSAAPATPAPVAAVPYASPYAAPYAAPGPPAAAAPPDAFVVDSYEAAAAPPPANYLNLILSIGGLLLLLGLVLYLAANRHPSERIDSTSLAGGDSPSVIEIGPQAAPLPVVPVAVPETVRVAPANPAPPVLRAARPVADSAAAPAAAADSTAVR